MDENQQIEPVEHSKITINGQEYDPSEAETLIQTGLKTREYEQKWNTPVDNVWPEYGKTREALKAKESEISQLKSELETFRQKQGAGVETNQDITQAKEAARKLGLLLNEDVEKAGYVKRDDLEKYLEERDAKRDQLRKATEVIESEGKKLAEELNGSDGRPKFNYRQALAYAQAYGMKSLKDAYEDMWADDLKTWKEQQVASAKKPGLRTLKSTPGNKQPAETKVDDSNVKNLLREKLWGKEE